MAHKYLNEFGISSDTVSIFNSSDIHDRDDEEFNRRLVGWRKQREEHSFDFRELWNLDFCSATWLYEHLKAFLSYTSIDLSYEKFTVITFEEIPESELEYDTNGAYPVAWLRALPPETLTLEDCIKTVLLYLEKYLSMFISDSCGHSNEGLNEEYLQSAFLIYAEILPALWD